MLISTRKHAILDYALGVALIAIPWVFDFGNKGAETWIPVLLGASTIGYSLITNYEVSVVKLVPMPSHLLLDVLSGVLLAASPWLFQFHKNIFWPHLMLGIFEIIVVSVSSSTSYKHSHQ